MSLNIQAHLNDIMEAIEDIDSFIGSEKLFDQFVNNKMLISAVERKIEIIGEAMSRIKRDAPELIIENQRAIISFRNRVIHAYDSIDKEVVWAVIINHLPKLKLEVGKLINDLNEKE